MSEKKIIAIDAMGGDNAPGEIVRGAVMGLAALGDGCESICLVGDEEAINSQLKKLNYDKARISIHHCTQIIDGCDTPTDAIKNKKDSSMVVGLNMLKKGEADAFISAGNTGALMAGAVILTGRIKGIERPAIGTLIPNKKSFTFLIDSGANADVKPRYLPQFALMGSIYMENIMKIEKPRVGLINVGSESSKGSELYKESYKLLESSGLNFVGNIEGVDIAEGKTDVLVCDGFVGNIILKYSEGLSKGLFSLIKEEITSTVKSKIAASLLKNDFARLKKRFDADEYGGAPLLGLKSLVVKAHGNSGAIAISNAIKQCGDFTRNDISGKIADNLGNLNRGLAEDE